MRTDGHEEAFLNFANEPEKYSKQTARALLLHGVASEGRHHVKQTKRET
jgi:hypothetical protein